MPSCAIAHMSSLRSEGACDEQEDSLPLIDGVDKDASPPLLEGDEREGENMAWRLKCSRKLRRTLRAILLGQVLSILLCGTAVFNQILKSDFSFTSSVSQSYVAYLLLGIVFAPVLAFQRDFLSILRKNWWKYALLAFVGVEANYLMVTAQEYTSMTSMQLLDNTTIISVMVLSFLFLRIRYGITHLAGVGSCMVGGVCLVVADLRKAQGTVLGAPLGDGLTLVASVLYAVSNVTQEFLVKKHSIVELLALLGTFGSIISGIQMCILENESLVSTHWWDYRLLCNLAGFVVCLCLFTALMPFVMKCSSAALINLSLLTSDFYGLLLGLVLFNYTFSWLYLLAFALVIVGVIVYNLKQTQVAQRNVHHALLQNIRTYFSSPN